MSKDANTYVNNLYPPRSAVEIQNFVDFPHLGHLWTAMACYGDNEWYYVVVVRNTIALETTQSLLWDYGAMVGYISLCSSPRLCWCKYWSCCGCQDYRLHPRWRAHFLEDLLAALRLSSWRRDDISKTFWASKAVKSCKKWSGCIWTHICFADGR